ncbi:matrixin family metalloprotease [Flavobacterium panacagri]|uniref:matrixin family metalloprotease n=1 Tax=Flavobacterium panacagri TaxID=3034146 RepID=UPI0025A600B1|nr:matrixin family metalloprotease [Flavobacterium panacagri]
MLNTHRLPILFIFLFLFSCGHEENQSPDNETELCNFNFIDLKFDTTTKPDAAIITWPRWKIGQTIKIKFLDGDAASQEKVKRIAGEWTKYANLTFEYVPATEYADIRIGFNVGSYGAWSVLGMKSAYGNTNDQSMRLGSLTSTNEVSIRRTILHEFGHALGLIHENSSPASTIKWDLPKVYQYYNELNGWSKDEVDQFVIKSPESTNYSQYDPLSIMHYYVPASLTTNRVAVNEMNDLSLTDIQSINKWYPFPIRSTIESGERIDYIPWTKAIKSSNGLFVLQFDSGMLSIKDLTYDTIIWQEGNSRYSNRPSCYLQSDGNLVIKGHSSGFTAPEQIIWTSDTAGFPGATLHLQDDGDLQLIYNGAVKWSSKNGKI